MYSRTANPAVIAQPFGTMSFFSALTKMLEIRRERAALAKLDADGLNDIGLTRKEVDAELARPVWDAPHHWKR